MQDYDEWFEENEKVFIKLPLVGEMTYNEWHAIILGSIGFLDPHNPFFILVVGLIASEGNARRTIRHEPWYFLTMLLGSTTLRQYIANK